jgi:hypothetical protein
VWVLRFAQWKNCDLQNQVSRVKKEMTAKQRRERILTFVTECNPNLSTEIWSCGIRAHNFSSSQVQVRTVCTCMSTSTSTVRLRRAVLFRMCAGAKDGTWRHHRTFSQQATQDRPIKDAWAYSLLDRSL